MAQAIFLQTQVILLQTPSQRPHYKSKLKYLNLLPYLYCYLWHTSALISSSNQSLKENGNYDIFIETEGQ